MKRRAKGRLKRRLKSPALQLLVALAGMVGGAWLIGMWAVGLVAIVVAVLGAADAVLRDVNDESGVLNRYRRER